MTENICSPVHSHLSSQPHTNSRFGFANAQKMAKAWLLVVSGNGNSMLKPTVLHKNN